MLVPRYREWTRRKTKVRAKGNGGGHDEAKEERVERTERHRERERERTREGKFGGDFQVWRVARVKAIHSITLWGYWDTLVRRTLVHVHGYVQHVHRSDGIMLEKLNFNSVKADVVFQATKESARRWISSCNSYRRISKSLSLLLLQEIIIIDVGYTFTWTLIIYHFVKSLKLPKNCLFVNKLVSSYGILLYYPRNRNRLPIDLDNHLCSTINSRNSYSWTWSS